MARGVGSVAAGFRTAHSGFAVAPSPNADPGNPLVFESRYPCWDRAFYRDNWSGKWSVVGEFPGDSRHPGGFSGSDGGADGAGAFFDDGTDGASRDGRDLYQYAFDRVDRLF